MQLASCLTQWWTSQGETARGVSDIIIQSSGSYLNYNQEVFIGFAERRCNSFPALGVRGIRSLAPQDTGCRQLLELGGPVGVYCNIRVTQDKIPTHPSICGLEHKFSSSLSLAGLSLPLALSIFIEWLCPSVCEWKLFVVLAFEALWPSQFATIANRMVTSLQGREIWLGEQGKLFCRKEI